MSHFVAWLVGVANGILLTAAFGEKVKASIAGLLTKTAAKIGNKSQ